MRQRKGCIYSEYVSAGRRVRGVGYVRKYRWVAQIGVGGKRYRCHSTSYRNVRAWLDDMLEKHPYVGPYRPRKKTAERHGI